MSNPQKLIQRLAKEKDATLAFFEALEPHVWAQQVYTDGARWTVLEVLAHFVNAESSVRRLMTHILQGGEGVPEDFDLDGYNERKVRSNSGQSPGALLASFAAEREETIHMVNGLKQADLEKRGRHPFLGITTIEEIIKLMYRHTMIHQRELRRAL